MTIIPAVLIGMLFPVYVAGAGIGLYPSFTGQRMTWFERVFLVGVGSVFGVLTGIFIARFVRRMLSVRKVLLFENDRIEIVTWRDKTFTAKLPDNIKHIAVIGSDFSVTFQIENRYFIVDSEQFSDKDGINEFFRHFVERCQIQVK